MSAKQKVPREAHVLHVDSLPARVAPCKICLVECLGDKHFCSFLDGLHGVFGEAHLVAVVDLVLANLSDDPGEGGLGKEELSGAGEAPDLALGNSAGLPPPLLLGGFIVIVIVVLGKLGCSCSCGRGCDVCLLLDPVLELAEKDQLLLGSTRVGIEGLGVLDPCHVSCWCEFQCVHVHTCLCSIGVHGIGILATAVTHANR